MDIPKFLDLINMNIPTFLDLIPEMLKLCITNDSMNKNSKKIMLNFTLILLE